MELNLTTAQKFIVKEMWILAWGASVQRAKLYKKNLSYKDRKASDFRSSLISYIEKNIFPSYMNGCDEEQHYKNINLIISRANTLGKGILGPDGYKYGVAQKLLNLAVKYLWCLGHIKEPPHCPVDRIVINNTKFKGKINWTDIKSREQYEKVINDIARIAGIEGSTPAQWELDNYERR